MNSSSPNLTQIEFKKQQREAQQKFYLDQDKKSKMYTKIEIQGKKKEFDGNVLNIGKMISIQEINQKEDAQKILEAVSADFQNPQEHSSHHQMSQDLFYKPLKNILLEDKIINQINEVARQEQESQIIQTRSKNKMKIQLTKGKQNSERPEQKENITIRKWMKNHKRKNAEIYEETDGTQLSMNSDGYTEKQNLPTISPQGDTEQNEILKNNYFMLFEGLGNQSPKNIICDFDGDDEMDMVIDDKNPSDPETANEETSTADQNQNFFSFQCNQDAEKDNSDFELDIEQNDTREINLRITTKSNQIANKINKLKQIQMKNLGMQPAKNVNLTQNIENQNMAKKQISRNIISKQNTVGPANQDVKLQISTKDNKVISYRGTQKFHQHRILIKKPIDKKNLKQADSEINQEQPNPQLVKLIQSQQSKIKLQLSQSVENLGDQSFRSDAKLKQMKMNNDKNKNKNLKILHLSSKQLVQSRIQKSRNRVMNENNTVNTPLCTSIGTQENSKRQMAEIKSDNAFKKYLDDSNRNLKQPPRRNSKVVFNQPGKANENSTQNFTLTSSSVSPNKYGVTRKQIYKNAKPYQQGQRTHNISPISRILPLNSALIKQTESIDNMPIQKKPFMKYAPNQKFNKIHAEAFKK